MGRFLQYCIQLPFYGYHLVEVRPSSSSGWDLPSVFYVALHVSGLFFVSADKEVFYSFPFTDILKHVSTPFSLQIGFDHKQELEVLTDAGDEIISLIIDYKYYHMKSSEENK